MATLMIDGQEIVLPKYNLNIMATAGAFVDEIVVAAEKGLDGLSFVEMNRIVENLTGFLAAGTVRVSADLTQERLGEAFTIADALTLQSVVFEVFGELGVDMKSAAAAPKSDEPSATGPADASVAEAAAV